jgi:chromosomal replication initiator protein
MIFVADIQREVARHYGIPLNKMREPRIVGRRAGANAFSVSRPRQVAMALSYLLTDQTKSGIGRLFGGRDHTTVIHAVRAIEQRRAKDPNLDRTLRRLNHQLVLRREGVL